MLNELRRANYYFLRVHAEHPEQVPLPVPVVLHPDREAEPGPARPAPPAAQQTSAADLAAFVGEIGGRVMYKPKGPG